MKKISIIVVNYQSASSINRLLASLENLNMPSDVQLDVLVLDSSGELLSEDSVYSPQTDIFIVELIRLPENRGFAYAVNVGLATAAARGTDYFWLLNPDVLVDELALKPLFGATQDESAAGSSPILGSLILEYDVESAGTGKIWGLGGFVDAEGFVSMGSTGLIGDSVGAEFVPSDYIPGCSMFFSADVLRMAGYFPEEYFLYFEETEWCLRAAKMGIRIFNIPQSIIFHSSPEGKMQKPWRVYFYNRSEILFRYRNFIKNGSHLSFLTAELKNYFLTFYAYLKSPSDLRLLFRAHLLLRSDFLKLVCSFMSPAKIASLSRQRLHNLKKE